MLAKVMRDSDYMQVALELAAKGAGYVSPNPMVGAVVVREGSIVGRGFHQVAGGPHAEVNALDEAGDSARGATLYVTLEPCNHHGRTPPCTEKILHSGIARVVVAMLDPNPQVRGGGNDRLRAEGLEVVSGVCESQARKLNESFINFVLTKRPFVTLKMAATLDGRIATASGDARWVTGAPARELVHRMRHGVDAILVGAGTVRADDPELTVRLADTRGMDPIRFVLDTDLTLSEEARMLNQPSTAGTYVVCSPHAAEADKRRLAAKGAAILEIPADRGKINLSSLVERMGLMGITSLLIEGGAAVAADALQAGIINKVVLFFAPKLLGGDDGVPLFRGTGAALMKDALPVKDVRVERVGEDILVEGYLRAIHK